VAIGEPALHHIPTYVHHLKDLPELDTAVDHRTSEEFAWHKAVLPIDPNHEPWGLPTLDKGMNDSLRSRSSKRCPIKHFLCNSLKRNPCSFIGSHQAILSGIKKQKFRNFCLL
jgi:hypothetical protein